MTVGVLNMSLRGGTLAGRFGLSLFIARYLSLGGVGTFGLVVGVISVAPAVLGFGMNYFLNRELVDLPVLDAARKIRDRLGLSLIMAVFALALYGAYAALGLVYAPHDLYLIVLIVLLEVIAFDVHMCLLAMRLPLVANIAVFVRSALWTAPFIALSAACPLFRTLPTLFLFWAAGTISSLAFVIWRVRAWPWRALAQAKLDTDWLIGHLKDGWLIYLSDLGIVSSQYADRFILSALLGIVSTGIFTFFWSFANSVQVLVLTGVIQVALPKLVSVYREQGEKAWLAVIRRELLIVLATGGALCIALYVCAVLFIGSLHKLLLSANLNLLSIMLFGVMARLASEVANFGLYTRGLDREYAIVNILSIPLSVLVSAAMIMAWGVTGAAIAMVVVGVTTFLIRLAIIVSARST